MFGYIVAGFDDIDTQETQRYQEVYCGLCHSIKNRYGQVSRLCLTYDLTFFALFFGSLYEPAEERGSERCAAHPLEAQPFVRSFYSDYAADLTVAFAYHKCLDDWNDDRSVAALSAVKLLEEPYRKAKERIPDQCEAIEAALQEITLLESDPTTGPDAVANHFGLLLAHLFAFERDHWSEILEEFGYHLGRFIYLMDAAVDYDDDKKSGSYNPFVPLDISVAERKTLLMQVMSKATVAFEKLPLVQDLHLLRSVLYAGVWQQFNKTFEAEMQALAAAAQNKDEELNQAAHDEKQTRNQTSQDEVSTSYV